MVVKEKTRKRFNPFIMVERRNGKPLIFDISDIDCIYHDSDGDVRIERKNDKSAILCKTPIKEIFKMINERYDT